jgi:tetratricopeptide (TPR) repeat protein
MRNKTTLIPIIFIICFVLTVGIYFLPPVHSRLSWRLDNLRTQIRYRLNPPEEAVFVPAQKTPAAAISIATATPVPLPTQTMPGPTSTSTPVEAPTITPTPLPKNVSLPDIVYVDQFNRWNYCGPANLAMALNFWGWKGTRDDIAKVVKPGANEPDETFIDRGKTDKNVMPYEMANFVIDETEFNVLVRYGGDMGLVKRLLAAGFPVLIEKGYYERDYTGKIAWMGHYSFVTGYDEDKGVFIYQDSYPPKDTSGKNREIKYEDFNTGWRSFDYIFLITYPPERESELFNLLAGWGDPALANQHALDIANDEVQSLNGMDGFFAWFNKGTSHVNLTQYAEAAEAYDQAFEIYAGLGQDDKQRPYRMMWYQTGPYKAYYYTGRYQDVINLANLTLESVSDKALEESIYWRGMAELAKGDSAAAIADFRRTVYLNSSFTPGIDALLNLGVQP